MGIEKEVSLTFTVYGKENCNQCRLTERKLKELGIEFSYIDITNDDEAKGKVVEMGYMQAPAVVASDGKTWAGYRPDLISTYA